MARLVLDTNSLLQCIFRLIVADPDDDKFVDCAVTGNAKYIVTEDSHYDVLNGLDFPRVDIIKLDDIIQKL